MHSQVRHAAATVTEDAPPVAVPNGGVEPTFGLVPAVPSIGSTVQRPERSVLGVIERTAGRDVAQAAGVTAGISNPERTRATARLHGGGNVAAVSVRFE